MIVKPLGRLLTNQYVPLYPTAEVFLLPPIVSTVLDDDVRHDEHDDRDALDDFDALGWR